ncbi:hypothetical protein [Microbacterium karelineae]|uniref:hypothetical protein n=1 Tax=Microbacterium karelineae TaxID=2654283 RepID=UPI0012E9BAB6|nr:hypothetical protein [Microbacterium karelineae]
METVASYLPRIFGPQFLGMIWMLIGSIAGATVVTTFGDETKGLAALAVGAEWLGLPTAVAEGLRAADDWFLDRPELLIVVTLLAITSFLVASVGVRASSTVPNGPAASTFFIALLVWGTFGFEGWAGTAILVAVVAAVIAFLRIRFGQVWDQEDLAINLFTIALTPLLAVLWLLLTMLFKKDTPAARE